MLGFYLCNEFFQFQVLWNTYAAANQLNGRYNAHMHTNVSNKHNVAQKRKTERASEQ